MSQYIPTPCTPHQAEFSEYRCFTMMRQLLVSGGRENEEGKDAMGKRRMLPLQWSVQTGFRGYAGIFLAAGGREG